MGSTEVLVACSLGFLIVTAVQAISRRRWWSGLWQFMVGSAAIGLAWEYLQMSGGRVAFGDDGNRIASISVIFAASLFGIGAHYFFYLRSWSAFDWLELLKPLFITPIIVLPLVGSIQQRADIETMQMVMLALLAFQNGFFWRAVFTKAQVHIAN